MKNSQTVAAIVPAYNESENITRVLDVLVKTEIIDEIIVVDDGSSDNTCEVVSQYGEVKLLLNGTNHGKAYSMQKGVDHAKAEIIFFCDADLRDFSPEIATAIIDPVLQKVITICILVSGTTSCKKWLNCSRLILVSEL